MERPRLTGDALVGSGANGCVIRARVLSLPSLRVGSAVALKINSHFWDDSARALLDCERRTLAALPPHPCVVKLYYAWVGRIDESHRPLLPEAMKSALALEDALHPFETQHLALELHPITLDSWRAVWPAGRLPYHILWRIARDVVAGVAHLDEHRVAHFDLKMDNILVNCAGGAVLADFGSSIVFEESPLLLRYHEPLGVLVNRTLLPPEVASSMEQGAAAWPHNEQPHFVDFSGAGVWAAALILWEFVGGCAPERDGEAFEVRALPTLRSSRYPEEFYRSIEGMLETQPSCRLSSSDAARALDLLAPRYLRELDEVGVVSSESATEKCSVVLPDGSSACVRALPTPFVAVFLRHWSGSATLSTHVSTGTSIADVIDSWSCGDAWRIVVPSVVAPPSARVSSVIGARVFLGGRELNYTDTLAFAFDSLTSPATEQAPAAPTPLPGATPLLVLDLAPTRAAAACASSLASIEDLAPFYDAAGSDFCVHRSDGRLRVSKRPAPIITSVAPFADVREAALLRACLSLTASSNSAIVAAAESAESCSFPFAAAADIAIAAVALFAHRHDVVAAAAGLLRNVSCAPDIAGIAVHLVDQGALEAIADILWAPKSTTSSPQGAVAQIAEDCVIAATNILRFPTQRLTLTLVARLARIVVHMLNTFSDSSQEAVPEVVSNSLRLLRYLVAVEIFNGDGGPAAMVQRGTQ